MIIAAAVISTGRKRLTPASQAAVSGSRPCCRSLRAKVTTSTELAVATPRLMIAPISAGTLTVVSVRCKRPDHAGQRAGQRGDDDERIEPALEIDDQQQVDQHDGHDQPDAQAGEAGVHRLRLAAQHDEAAARQLLLRLRDQRLDVAAARRPGRARSRRRRRR